METRRDINGITPSIGNTIIFPQSFGGKRRLTKSVVINIGKLGNPVISTTGRRYRNRQFVDVTIKRPITTDFVII